MQSNPKPQSSGQDAAKATQPAPVADVAVAEAAASGAAHASPARALQARLVRELSRPSQPWLWHSAGLVLTVVLSLWIAGLMLAAGG